MAVANLVNEPQNVNPTRDSIVIVRILDAVRGGGALDMTGFTDEIVEAGHVIIIEDDSYKPLGVTGSAYKALTGDQKYVGVLINTTMNPTDAGILTQGTVNPEACKYKPTAAVLAGLPLIQFRAEV